MNRAEAARKQFTTHGMFGTRFYEIYTNIRSRCTNKKYPYFKDYGGRGIKCLWESFEDFRDDMYGSYQKHFKEYGNRDTFIERVDNDGPYCKENCRWATRKEQARNTRHTIWITYAGQRRCMSEWADIIGIRRESLRNMLMRDGKTLKDVFHKKRTQLRIKSFIS